MPSFVNDKLPAIALGRGFTLIEMMVAVAVLAILLAIAVPSFNDATLGSKLTAYANSLVGSAGLARSEALKRNSAVTICKSNQAASPPSSTCNASGGWEQGWIVRASDGTVIQRQEPLADGLLIDTTAAAVIFQPSGLSATSTTFTICRATPTAGTQERQVTIRATGSAWVKAISNTTSCP